MHIGRCLQHSPAPEVVPNVESVPVTSETEVHLNTAPRTNIETMVDDAQNMDDSVEVALTIEIEPVKSKTETDLDAFLKTNMQTMIEGAQNMDHCVKVDTNPKHTPYMQTSTFRLHLLKVGATIALHSRYVTFSIALSAEQLWICFGITFCDFGGTACPISNANHLI